MSRTITIRGTAQVSTKPDLVILTIKLRAKDKEYDQAMEKASHQLSQLKESLLSIGFEDEEIKTTYFSVDTDYENQEVRSGYYKRIFLGFVCHHHLKLSFDLDMEKLSKTLTTITHCVAEPELGISFTVKDATMINEELLRVATVNAKRKADLLCEASGVSLGPVLRIDYNWNEINIYSNTQFFMTQESMGLQEQRMGKSLDLQPDNIDLRDTVTFVWEIKEAL